MEAGYPYEVRVQRIYYGKNPTNQRETIYQAHFISKEKAEEVAEGIYKDSLEVTGAEVYVEGCSVINHLQEFCQVVHVHDYSEFYPSNHS